jgi:hypothetical protein
MAKAVDEQEQQEQEAPKVEDYPWAADAEERCRTFVFDRIGSPDIDGAVLVDNMDRVYQWVRFGKKLPKKPSLKTVEKEG